jgi:menaquinone-specific isochorismate synthase
VTQSDVTVLNHASRLVARSEAIDAPEDLLDELEPGGFAWLDADHGFVASGVAARVAPGDAVALLASIVHHTDADTPSAAGPRAVGALPFVGSGALVVPACVVGRDPDGRTWRTRIDHIAAPAPLHVAAPAPTRFSVSSDLDAEHWRAMVARALEQIAAGDLEKVVLARTATVRADQPWDPRGVLATLRATQPGCVVYGDGDFVGASPELLVRKVGTRITARPLAGTGTDPSTLLRSEKDAREHALAVEAVVAAVGARCNEVRVNGPSALAFANVSHLATTVSGEAADDDLSVVDLMVALHPTPAVAGTPHSRAVDAIAALEPFSRGHYAGPCGWVDACGDGMFVVALRGGELDGTTATLYAGAGIVAGSDPDAEWAETQQKLMPMLQALIRP